MNDQDKIPNKARRWFLTINNPAEQPGHDHDSIKALYDNNDNIRYWCMADEIGEEGTYHTHVAIYTKKNGITFATMKKDLPRANIQEAKGTPAQARAYIRKEGEHEKKAETSLPHTFYESGPCPDVRPGQRNDIIKAVQAINEGATPLDLIQDNPKLITQFSNLDKYEQRIAEKDGRNMIRDLHVLYQYGDPGAGKTHSVYLQHGIENVYTVKNYDNPFDEYQKQPVLLLEEFWSQLPLTFMNHLLDKWPLMLPSRYNNKRAHFTSVVINSNIPLEKQYKNIRQNDPRSFAAFTRRIHEVNVYRLHNRDADGFVIPTYYTIQAYARKYMSNDEEVLLAVNYATEAKKPPE